MAFSAAGLNCIAVGPTKMYIYYTTDALTTASVKAKTYGLCTDNCPGMAAGDIVLLAHNTNAAIDLIRITAIAATTCTYAEVVALA